MNPAGLRFYKNYI